MKKNNWKNFNLNHRKTTPVPYSGVERRQENDPSYFGYFALEGIERRQPKETVYKGEERRQEQDPAYFGYFALEGIERRQAGGVFC
ncbi:MAG: hypothetical protein JRI93_15585 [Deltaproteobacteria bacterium]|nr:hypothetical protein [Deltaproteobacteria bacterium]